jgi:hypothetical protein
MAKRRPARSGYSSHPIPLIARRIEIEAHLAALLKQSGSGATVEQFKKFTYEKGSVIPFGDYVSLAFREFPTLRRDVDIDTRLSVLTDAWGYFPHRARGGRCPAKPWLDFKRNERPLCAAQPAEKFQQHFGLQGTRFDRGPSPGHVEV